MTVTLAPGYRELHELIDQLEPEQADELHRHAQRLVERKPSRFRYLRTFDGPPGDLSARAKDVIRAELGQDSIDR